MKKIHIISGGTVAHIATHLALSAPAYGAVGDDLYVLCDELMPELEVNLHVTKMAGGFSMETNENVKTLVDELIADPDTKIIFMPVALCDFVADRIEWFREDEYHGIVHGEQRPGKGSPRLQSRDFEPGGPGEYEHPDTYHPRLRIALIPAPKIIPTIRAKRKDIFLVGFKTTDGATEDEQYLAGLALCKGSSCNLVLANDVKTRVNMIITPEEARYHVTKDRQDALRNLVDMSKLRSHLMFTRSTVVAGEPVPWSSDLVPATLRSVVDHLIRQGAYKPFQGATVGHFACKLPPQECKTCDWQRKGFIGTEDYGCSKCGGTGRTKGDTFLTSQRKTNFNDLAKLGLVMVRTDGPDSVLAYGAKPSVGGQSQRILFGDHPEFDCVVHAHVPLKTISKFDYQGVANLEIPVVSQREFECGSHQCGKNTSNGMKVFVLPSGYKIMAVMLDQHGPNILFHHSAPAQEICDFIDANFDLSKKTGGYVA